MKFKSILLAAIFGQIVYGAEPAEVKSAKVQLGAVFGSDRIAAQELLTTMKSGSSEPVRAKMHELVRQNKSYLVVIALSDSDWVKTEAAKALASVKKKSVAHALLKASEELDGLISGGTETQGMRELAKAECARSLTAITGVEVKKDWSHQQRVNALKEAISKLPE